MHFERRQQLSVFLENRVGALSELLKLISDRSINLLAICAIDTVEEAVLRVVAENGQKTLAALHEAGFHVLETEVLVITLDNAAGATGTVATRLAQAGINIDYLYASAHPDMSKACLVLRTHQMDEAASILKGAE